MMKRWNVVGLIVGNTSVMLMGCGAEEPAAESALRSEEVDEARSAPIVTDGSEMDIAVPPPETCQGDECLSALPPGRCIFGEGCAVACVYPADGCDRAGDEICLGYCMANDQCVSDASCAGGQRCLDCAVPTDSGSCVEVCEPIDTREEEPPPPVVEPPPPVEEPPVQIEEPPPPAVEPPPPPPPPKDDCPEEEPPPPVQAPPVEPPPPVQAPPAEPPPQGPPDLELPR